MKILISGKPQSGQAEIIRRLTGRKIPLGESVSGYVLDHEFKTKYFSAECGIWADEFDDASMWSQEFSSEEAQEIRQALILFIYTVESSNPQFSGLEKFTSLLDRPGMCLAIAKDGVEITKAKREELTKIGFDITTIDELEPIVQSALFDAISDKGPSDEEQQNEMTPVIRELDDIMEELKDALHSKTMTKEEKLKLAEKLADELVL